MRGQPTRDCRQLDRLLDELLDLTPAERTRRLANLRAEQPDQAAELERLLAFCLEDSAELGPGGALSSDLVREALLGTGRGDEVPPGTEIGPYVIEALIGRGGMAEVYRASRAFDGFAQAVALKLVRSDKIGGNLRERLLSEQRALVRLEHPNIARFLDAGIATDGSVYLAMELVDGRPIVEQANAHRADLAARVRWVIDLCDALDHAHSQLVVHCDIKPSNVLVDQGGRLRLLDFGIASVLNEAEPASPAGLKHFTPDCAAPEQVTGEPVGTTTDVFQAGALLYRLVVGQSWLRRPGLESGEELAAVLHASPVAPSQHLRTAADDPLVQANAVACGFAGAAALARKVDARLDAIVLKCLARAPAGRYANVASLRADLQAWLQHRPVSALAAGRATRMRLWLRRNGREAAVAVAGIACLALVSAVYVFRVTEERDAKARELQRAQAVEGFLGRVFEQASPYLREDSENALQTLVRVGDSMLADDPRMDPRTRFGLSVVLAGLEMDQGLPARVEARARDALARDGASAEPLARLRMQRLLAGALAQQERAAEAVEVLERAMAGLAAPATAAESNARALLQAQLGGHYAAVGRLDEATPQFDAAFDVLVSPQAPLDGESLQALDRLARNLDFGQRGEDQKKVKAVLRRLSVVPVGESAMHKALRLQSLGYVEGLAGRPIDGAERSREAALVLAEALGPTHPQVAKAMGAACTNFINGGGIVQAREACARAVEMEVEGGRGDGARARNIRVNVAIVDLIRGDLVSSASLMRQVLESVERESDPQLHLFGEGVLARVDLRQGRYRESLARLNMLWAMVKRDFPENEDMHAEIGATRADVLIELGRLGEARRALDESEMTVEVGGLRDRVLPGRLITRGNLAAAEGRHEEAIALAEQGLQGFESHAVVSQSELGLALLDGGEVLLRAGALPRAREVFERAMATGFDPEQTPAPWAWAVLRLEQLDPGRHPADVLERAVGIARHQFGPSGGQATPCLRLPPVLGGGPDPQLRARTTCL